MATEQIGYRRLYDAIGCSLANQEEFGVSTTIGEFEVRVNIGTSYLGMHHPSL